VNRNVDTSRRDNPPTCADQAETKPGNGTTPRSVAASRLRDSSRRQWLDAAPRVFLRVMAIVQIIKGSIPWAQVTGLIGGEEEAFENQSMAWQDRERSISQLIEIVALSALWTGRTTCGRGVDQDSGVECTVHRA